jgi:glycosyltransferase involved in cell wall biosynthesis
MRVDPMRTVVSITPMAVERDSRTFKQAASVARFGYASLVVEGHASRLDRGGLPFMLRSLSACEARSRGVTAVPSRDARTESLGCRLKQLVSRVPGVAYTVDHLYRYGLRTFLATPKASLYYLHAFNQFPAVWLRCRIHGSRYIYDAHDFYAGIEEARDLGWAHRIFRLPWERWLEKHCIRRAAAVVTVSKGVAALQRRAFGCQPVVVRNCEDRRLRRAPSRGLRDTVGAHPTDFLFAVVGHAKVGQAIPEMLEALTATPATVHVALVGMGYERFASRIRALNLEPRVHMILPVKPFEVAPFIESADASLLLYYTRSANYTYCLPNGFFQAIAAGLPLLYPKLPEVWKVATEYDLGLPIDPTSAASIADGMLAFFQQSDRVSVYRRNAKRAGDVLNWEHEERVLAAVLERALSGPGAGKA